MNIQLSARANDVIQRKLAEGEFVTVEQVIEQALQLFEAPEPTPESLQAKLQKGLADLEAGRVGPLDVEAIIRERSALAGTEQRG